MLCIGCASWRCARDVKEGRSEFAVGGDVADWSYGSADESYGRVEVERIVRTYVWLALCSSDGCANDSTVQTSLMSRWWNAGSLLTTGEMCGMFLGRRLGNTLMSSQFLG